MAKAASKVEEGSQVGTAWPSRQAATMAEDWEKVTAEAEAEKYRHLVAAVDSVGGSGRSPAARWRRARRIARPPYCGKRNLTGDLSPVARAEKVPRRITAGCALIGIACFSLFR